MIRPEDRPKDCKGCVQKPDCDPKKCKAQGIYRK